MAQLVLENSGVTIWTRYVWFGGRGRGRSVYRLRSGEELACSIKVTSWPAIIFSWVTSFHVFILSMVLYGPLCAYPLIVCGKYDRFQGSGRYCRQASPRTIGHGTPVV